ncbi:MAG: hypothetical protein H0U52_01490 [Chloroflexi bacterium]|nr:hypothetical protein [Chloroflexota bacterium]
MTMEARINGDQVKCWNCKYTLGQIGDGVEEPHLFGTRGDIYRHGAVPEAAAAVGIRSVLIIMPRAKRYLARTGLPYRRHRFMHKGKDGGIGVAASTVAAMPVLMQCFQPGCGQPNRVVDKPLAGGA